ncbi:MAG: hypothetical protein ABI747_00595 [Candidatus Moraniibacteriota bacterium]
MSANRAFHNAIAKMRRMAERIPVTHAVALHWPDAPPMCDPRPYGDETQAVMQCGAMQVVQNVVGDFSHDPDHQL